MSRIFQNVKGWLKEQVSRYAVALIPPFVVSAFCGLMATVLSDEHCALARIEGIIKATGGDKAIMGVLTMFMVGACVLMFSNWKRAEEASKSLLEPVRGILVSFGTIGCGVAFGYVLAATFLVIGSEKPASLEDGLQVLKNAGYSFFFLIVFDGVFAVARACAMNGGWIASRNPTPESGVGCQLTVFHETPNPGFSTTWGIRIS